MNETIFSISFLILFALCIIMAYVGPAYVEYHPKKSTAIFVGFMASLGTCSILSIVTLINKAI